MGSVGGSERMKGGSRLGGVRLGNSCGSSVGVGNGEGVGDSTYRVHLA